MKTKIKHLITPQRVLALMVLVVLIGLAVSEVTFVELVPAG